MRPRRDGRMARSRSRGLTLVEVLVAAALSALLVSGIVWLLQQSMRAKAALESQQALHRDAQFALERMTQMIRSSRRLLLPLPDNPATTWREHVREQTVPASAPEAGSAAASAVLALTLPFSVDLNGDGFPDADNDKDGRIDEDTPADMNGDLQPGLAGIDDDGDGQVDEGDKDDDDEDGSTDEDRSDGDDGDGDRGLDEDWHSDNNQDGKPGRASIDDDGDGQVDEGDADDDDEDGSSDEDWLDAVAYVLQGGSLVERMPVPWDANADGKIDGLDVVESEIARGVTRLRVERVPDPVERLALVDLTIDLAGPEHASVSLTARVRVGSLP